MKKFLYVFFILLIGVGSFLVGSWHNQRNAAKGNFAVVKPVAVSAEKTPDTDTDTSSLPPGTVKISPGKQQVIGVKVALVERSSWSHIIRVLGRVAPDETRIYRINAATDGWVKKMLPVTTGSLVQKDELLATFYAPEFASAMKAYLYGLRSLDRFQASGKEPKAQIELTDSTIDNYRNSLRNLGMTEHQLDEIQRTREGGNHVEIRAPEAGFILARNLTLGERFQRGTELYRIADLSHVWILADVFGKEASYLRPGNKVGFSLPDQERVFQATVSQVLPQFDSATRTLKVRLEADNPGFALRPDMFVDVEFPIKLPPSLTVPMDAVLDSGLRKTVTVDRGDGLFESREVETGWRIGNRVEIVKGIEPGERIVISGNFLIDSESKLEMAAQGMYTTLSRDPVCGLEVSPKKAEKAGRKIAHVGKTYYFCSDECKQQFQKESSRFIKAVSQETSAESTPSSKSPHSPPLKKGGEGEFPKGHGHDHSS